MMNAIVTLVYTAWLVSMFLAAFYGYHTALILIVVVPVLALMVRKISDLIRHILTMSKLQTEVIQLLNILLRSAMGNTSGTSSSVDVDNMINEIREEFRRQSDD